jgi:hypothetical protein
VLFIRILTKESTCQNDTALSRKILHHFMVTFENLYDRQHLSFNLHAHQHLPDQAELFGPLNKISCFSFEGVFKTFKRFFNGTRGISQQIAHNRNVSSYMHFKADKIIESVTNPRLNNFLMSLSATKEKTCSNNTLIRPLNELNIKDVHENHRVLFHQKEYRLFLLVLSLP